MGQGSEWGLGMERDGGRPTRLTSVPTNPPGPVTNAVIMLAPVGMLSSDFRPSLPLPYFNRHLLGAEHGDEPHRGGFTLRLGLHQQVRASRRPVEIGWGVR